jgi:mono/diheme cytochrome c family protein
MKRVALSVMALLFTMGARADESQLRLADAPGRETVMANCRTCHSVDYVLIHDGIPDRNGWEASIAKMRKIMGATISDADAAVILDYLANNYARGGKAAAPP